MGIFDAFRIGNLPAPPSMALPYSLIKAAAKSTKNSKSRSQTTANKSGIHAFLNPFSTGPTPIPPSVSMIAGLGMPAIRGITSTGPRPSPLAGGGYNGSVNAFTSTNPKYGEVRPGFVGEKMSESAASAIPDIKYDPFVDPYAKFDPVKMAAAEFNPQYALLDQMAKQTEANYGRASKDIGNAWDLLAKEIAGKAGGIKGSYEGMGRNIESGYGKVKGSTDAEYEAAKAEILANAKRTGTESTVGGILARLAQNRSDLNATTGAYQQTASGFNQQMGANALEENRMSAENAQYGGINARADFAARLQNALGDIANKRLETKAAQGKAVNEYGLGITDRSVSAKQAWDTLQTQRAQQAIDFASSQAEAAAKAAEAASKGQKDIDTTKLTPTEYLSYLAQVQYPNVGESTRQNAIRAIQDTFMFGAGRGTNWANAAQFVEDLKKRNPNAWSSVGGDANQLAQMAQDYYAKIAGGANKPYGQRT